MKELYPRGTKVKIPKTKMGAPMVNDKGDYLCFYAKKARDTNQDYLYYSGISCGEHCLNYFWNPNEKPRGNFYSADEIIPYPVSSSNSVRKTINKQSIIYLIKLTKLNPDMNDDLILEKFIKEIKL